MFYYKIKFILTSSAYITTERCALHSYTRWICPESEWVWWANERKLSIFKLFRVADNHRWKVVGILGAININNVWSSFSIPKFKAIILALCIVSTRIQSNCISSAIQHMRPTYRQLLLLLKYEIFPHRKMNLINDSKCIIGFEQADVHILRSNSKIKLIAFDDCSPTPNTHSQLKTHKSLAFTMTTRERNESIIMIYDRRSNVFRWNNL